MKVFFTYQGVNKKYFYKFDVSSSITVSELINYLNNLNNDYRKVFVKKDLIKIAVNKTYCSVETKINNNDEIAFFPPVTGG